MLSSSLEEWEDFLELPKGSKLEIECEAEVEDWTEWPHGVTDKSDHLDWSVLESEDEDEEGEEGGGGDGIGGFEDWEGDEEAVEGEDLILKDLMPGLGGEDDEDVVVVEEEDEEEDQSPKRGRGKGRGKK